MVRVRLLFKVLIFEKQYTIAPFNLTLDQEGVGGITGEAPTLALRDATTTGSYLDFGDLTFKTSGWTFKYVTMSEVERGHYTFFLNPSIISGISVGTMLSAEYRLDSGPAKKGDDQETALFVESIVEIPTDTAALVAALPIGLTPDQATWLQEVWQILGLDITAPLTVSKTSRTASTISQDIEENVPTAGSVKVTRQ